MDMVMLMMIFAFGFGGFFLFFLFFGFWFIFLFFFLFGGLFFSLFDFFRSQFDFFLFLFLLLFGLFFFNFLGSELEVESDWKLEIELASTALMLSAESIEELEINFGAIKSSISLVDLKFFSKLSQSRLKL
jgi:hypothetical protein